MFFKIFLLASKLKLSLKTFELEEHINYSKVIRSDIELDKEVYYLLFYSRFMQK